MHQSIINFTNIQNSINENQEKLAARYGEKFEIQRIKLDVALGELLSRL